jgi:hypothetical protein
MVESRLVATVSYYEVSGVEPVCGGRGRWPWSKWIQFRPTDVQIHCSHLGDGQLDALVTGPVVARTGVPLRRALRPCGVLFDEPIEEWPEWLRRLAECGRVSQLDLIEESAR